MQWEDNVRSAGVPSTDGGVHCKRIISLVWISGVCVFPLPHDSLGSEIMRTRTF